MAFGIPTIFWLIFLFALGASVGSFLNVVVYRLPLELSLIKPDSHCPACKHPIAWYDNIPIFAWFYLGGRCRHCKARFSFRYPAVELITALLFVGLFWLYFVKHIRTTEVMGQFETGGWLIYLGHIVLICVLWSSSLIDAEHWIIPLSLSYTPVVVGLVLSMITPYFLDGSPQEFWRLIPWAGIKTASCAAGAALGLIISLILVKKRLITRSFAQYEATEADSEAPALETEDIPPSVIRKEMVRELVFIAPIVLSAIVVSTVFNHIPSLTQWRLELLANQPWLSGLLGSIFGFMIGGGVVWATRILGSLAFGREAMGLGDVHLMAGVGAMLGWASPTIAFFAAPFLGLGWAICRLILHRSREIPYGPFLSMATVLVMIFHDQIVNYFLQSMRISGPAMP